MRIPHALNEEFPDEVALIDRLLNSSREFTQLAASYDGVNRQIYRIETEEEPTTDEVLQTLKKRRLELKDEIAASLARLERRM